MTTNNAAESTTIINNYINVNEAELRELIAKEIELQCSSKCDIKDWVDDSPVKVCSHKEDAAIARGQK